MVREQTCCFTGHRELPVWGRKQLAAKLEATITGLIDRGIIFYGAGGARGFETLSTLVEKGISGGDSAARTLHMLTYQGRDSWIAESLLEKRMWVDVNDYPALQACVENDAVDVAKLLLDGGMDFDQYRQRYPNSVNSETIQALEEHWNGICSQTQEQEPELEGSPEMGGITFA